MDTRFTIAALLALALLAGTTAWHHHALQFLGRHACGRRPSRLRVVLFLVGYGDIVPLGALRLVACVESLNGLLLLAWSGAFLYGVLDGPGYRSR
jgi:hypothetical protein